MLERRVMVKAFASEYQRGSKKEKGTIFDTFVETTGYQRRYAAQLLRLQGRRGALGKGVWVEADVGDRRRRKRIYDEEVKRALKRIGQMLDYLCGKRLVAALEPTLAALEKHQEWQPSAEVGRKLLSISAATIDRLLAPEKKKLRLRQRGGTKPGTLLRHQVAVRTFADWDDARPGFVEVDLVAHEGDRARGDYAQTLDLTDVSTGWTELAAVPNKAQVWVFEAIQQLRQGRPFALVGLDSDNGSEFINNQRWRYCEQEQLTMTRSRPHRKNDNCFVEQKNYSVVRRYVGYARYDTPGELALLNQLYEQLRLYVNFFLPSQKLEQKVRRGSRVSKRYSPAKTPYQRVLESTEVSTSCQRKLRAQYGKLNPAQLHREIVGLQEKLMDLTAKKRRGGAVDGAVTEGNTKRFPTAPWKTPGEFPTPPTAPTTPGQS